jgi:hypothetical protein
VAHHRDREIMPRASRPELGGGSLNARRVERTTRSTSFGALLCDGGLRMPCTSWTPGAAPCVTVAVVSAIWRLVDEEWAPLLPSGFPSEEKLHDLVEAAPNLLPLSGDATIIMLGREVALGPGYADLVAVDTDGRLTVIEIKLRKNAEARRAVVAQVLTYAAYLKGLTTAALEDLLRPHLTQRDATSIVDLVRGSEYAGELDEAAFAEGVKGTLDTGGFRLVLVLDETPSELVQLVGYLESISSGIALDLVTFSAYDAGNEQLLVPQRVDPEYQPEHVSTFDPLAARRAAKARREVDGSDAFEASIERSPESDQPDLRRVLAWARGLESERLATLRTVFGDDRDVLRVWIRGSKAGLVSIWNENGASISLWRSVFVRLAWAHIARIEELIGTPIGQGNVVEPSPELLDALSDAYRDAAKPQAPWNEQDFYVSFGEGPTRDWDDAVEFGFVSAGGGEWYSKTLGQLAPGHRVFVYIPKGHGVGGYVGFGEVTARVMPMRDFVVEKDGRQVPFLEVTRTPAAREHVDDEARAEYVVPVRWLRTLSRDAAIKDSDFFANQNCAVKLTHGYTLQRLAEEFDVEETAVP